MQRTRIRIIPFAILGATAAAGTVFQRGSLTIQLDVLGGGGGQREILGAVENLLLQGHKAREVGELSLRLGSLLLLLVLLQLGNLALEHVTHILIGHGGEGVASCSRHASCSSKERG